MALIAARKASGKTQAQVAQEAGIHERLYQYYESGEKKPAVDTALRIAEALGIDTMEQFRGVWRGNA